MTTRIGDQIGFAFSKPFAQRVGDQIGFAFGVSDVQEIEVTGWQSAAFGDAFVSADSVQAIEPEGWLSSVFGGTAVTPGLATITPVGFSPMVFGGHQIVNTAFGIFPGGIAPPPSTGPNSLRQIPDPWVSFWTRVLNVHNYGIPVPTNQIPLTHVVAFEIQFIDLAGRGIDSWASGTARIEFAFREIAPPFIASMIFGTPNVARIQVIDVAGWESSFISHNHQLDINLQRIFHHSGEADPAEYGATHARNQFEVLSPQAILPQTPGFPVVFNYTQQLFVQPYMGSNSDPTQWPTYYPFVENQHRYLGPSGWQSSRFSVIGNIVENTAAPLHPPGLDATLWGPETFIAYRIRHVYPEGWDSFYNTQYTVIHNDAVVLAPQGWASSSFGRPDPVLNLNREVRHHSGPTGPSWGVPFIAPAVRTVFPGLFYDVPSGFPEVRLNPYPVAPTGIDSYRTGGHDVRERFNIVYPASTNVPSVPRIGEPIVENRNKTLYVFPSDQALYGLARIFNYNTYITATAGETLRWGSHLISYRTKTLVPAPIGAPLISVFHQVRNEIPDPPAPQRVEPGSIFIGTLANPGIVPAPAFNYATIFPGGFASVLYGAPTVTRNAIEPGSIIDLAQVGIPTLLFTQYCYPHGIPWPRMGPANPDGSVGESDLLAHQAKPRITPHTVYAPYGDQATAQARLNHPTSAPHVIDEYTFPAGIRFGYPDVSNQYRTIGPVPNHAGSTGLAGSSRVGLGAEVTLRLRYVYPFPIRSFRSGLPVFLNVPQYIGFEWPGGWSSSVVGDATVAFPYVQAMPAPQGFEATLWGNTMVSLFNREVSPQGIPHRGNPQQGFTNPWGLHLVGFPREYVLGGFEATLWGTHRVEHRIRNLYAFGWDSYADTLFDISDWADRMRVTRRNPPGGVAGISSDAAFGLPIVTFYMQTILGRGVASYVSGSHIVRASSHISPTGWVSSAFGDIDEWEAGKIKPHGDDLSAVGYPRLLHPIAPEGIDLGNTTKRVGEPTMGVPIYVFGMPPIGFDGPSVSNPYGCTNRVVTPLPVLSAQDVPTPAISYSGLEEA